MQTDRQIQTDRQTPIYTQSRFGVYTPYECKVQFGSLLNINTEINNYDLLFEGEEDTGPRAGQQGETEFVTKEDNKDKTEADEKCKQEDRNDINK